ncbi:MAG: tRNA (adenosine(37)-N6)-threonylcarbamoyltransferase complex transferase subunit TsaD, partial [Candidatus Nealsonbacteria bacterium]|nr:tRNA (adenosine(37)-N6)-threonylcarbamoyltransferase complex transferase subunit TsaD [Candidatus Nealsonbacteria bacterium]
MIILGIDTSCDDTCVAVLEIKNGKLKIESNIVSSQVKLHAKYGGVYPMLAKREHQRNLPVVLRRATKNIDILKIDEIAVTVGPGLEPCLWQGINFAKELAEKLKKPLILVNHIEAHIAANFIEWSPTSLKFPAVCLVVSGGHTQIILMKQIGSYKLLGETRDDAAGECFDKAARILGLGYPGGPVIARLSTQWKSEIRSTKSEIKLPRPMMHTKDYDFSFSGLKTAVLYKNQNAKIKNQNYKWAMAAEIQQAIIDVLIYKTLKAAKDFKVKSIILGGGVSANDELSRQFKLKIVNYKLKIDFFVPEKILCTDNAAMVAVAGYWHKREA